MFIHDRRLQKLVKNPVILECSFHKVVSKGEKTQRRERQNTFSCVLSQGHSGQLRKVLFNMPPGTLFMHIVYDAYHIYIATKTVKSLQYTHCCYCAVLDMQITLMFIVGLVFKREKQPKLRSFLHGDKKLCWEDGSFFVKM